MTQSLHQAYANIVDFGAVADRPGHDNRPAIQAAIDSGRHVLVPRGVYSFTGALRFNNEDQRCTFLSGAVLQAGGASEHKGGDPAGHLVIGSTKDDLLGSLGSRPPPASRQVFDGLCIEVADGAIAHNPLVEVRKASITVFRDLRVTVGAIVETAGQPSVAVSVRNSVGVKFLGGCISGAGASGTVGLWFTDFGEVIGNGAYESGGVGLCIKSFGWAFRLDATVDEPSFVACTFADNVDGAILVTGYTGGFDNPTSTCLRLIACRFYGGSPGQYILLDNLSSGPCYWHGGTVLGCVFDEPGAGEAGSATTGSSGKSASSTAGKNRVVPSRSGTKKSAVDAKHRSAGKTAAQSVSPADPCIIRVRGTMDGVVVAGCRSFGAAARPAVWVIHEHGNVGNTVDSFNAWAQDPSAVAVGNHSFRLVQLATTEAGALKITARSQRLNTTKVGFFDKPPAESPVYPASAVSPSRALSSLTAPGVLAQLIADLTALGILKKG